MAVAVLGCGHAHAATFNGFVFEDANYGGGAGRARIASGGTGVPNAIVELYRVDNGNWVATAITGATGAYTLTSGNTGQPMRVRVVNGSVRSARTGGAACTTCVAVQTFRTDASTGAAVAVTNRVGGEAPASSDAFVNPGTSNYSTLTAGGRVPQSITTADPAANNSIINNIDFGFNFDTIVNTRDATNCAATNSSYPCQGSLRQFIINSSALGGEGALSQSGDGQIDGVNNFLPGGSESSIFMIPSAALTGNVAVITLASVLPAIAGTATRLDATTQTVNIGNTNAGTLGTGGTVGVDAIALPTFPRPEVQLTAGNTIVTLSGAGSAVLGFALRQGYLLLSGTGCLARNNLVGMTAAGDSNDNSTTTFGIEFAGANSTVRNNFVTVNNSGIRTQGGGTGSLITLNEVARPGSNYTNTFDGILLVGTVSNIQVTANLTREQRGGGIEVGFGDGATASNITVTNNTVRNNGFANGGSGAASSEPIGMAAYDYVGTNVVFSRNIVRDNAGAGLLVMDASGTTITQNSFSNNGGLSIDLDPRSVDPNGLNTLQGVTLNDNGDTDTGPNGLRNYPVMVSASLIGAELSLSGFARPNSAIELYLTQADPSGFGEGMTYLGLLTEGSPADLDATTGVYGPANINGVAQGTDNTNRFSFRLTAPGGVAIGTHLTGTATITGETSEFGGNVVVTGGPALRVAKTVAPTSDPVNGVSNPKSIPGSVQLYNVRVTNQGGGPVDNNAVAIVDSVPANTRLFVGNLGAPGSGPVTFVNGSPSSALTWTFTALNSTTDDVDFSNDGGVTWTYVPVPDANGYDAAVTTLRMRPKGTMPGNGGGNPYFELRFRVIVN
ncbi:MAG TPA: right-handed parallel beta-helix repeat-containing protein [Steroidobacteraceae bacterium]|nr:right-handed parallel beta-helix repeat-containing protein [Steroidobacteraceae bacterium]